MVLSPESQKLNFQKKKKKKKRTHSRIFCGTQATHEGKWYENARKGLASCRRTPSCTLHITLPRAALGCPRAAQGLPWHVPGLPWDLQGQPGNTTKSPQSEYVLRSTDKLYCLKDGALAQDLRRAQTI